MKILLVEDNSNNIRLIEQLIEDINENIELIITTSGLSALKAAEEMEFDLILMDISLPDMDGVTITKELKKLSKFDKTPIIVVTAHAMSKDEETFRTIFDDYISKPIDDELFIEKVEKWIGVIKQ